MRVLKVGTPLEAKRQKFLADLRMYTYRGKHCNTVIRMNIQEVCEAIEEREKQSLSGRLATLTPYPQFIFDLATSNNISILCPVCNEIHSFHRVKRFLFWQYETMEQIFKND